MELMDRARGIAGVPFVVNSGSRCPEHNKKEGGEPTSSHVNGLAVDIRVNGSGARYKILHAMMAVGLNRLGVAKGFIHCDIDNSKSPNVLWTY
jgi:uncharacterized protein YcbK (DUF882 family)